MTEIDAWLQAYVFSGDAAVWFRFAALLGVFLLGFWKALPAVLDAFERKQSGIETRVADILDQQTKRFNEQLAQADDRHEECMRGQQLLRERIAAMEKEHGETVASLRKENRELWGTINAMRQGHLSAQSVVANAIKEARG